MTSELWHPPGARGIYGGAVIAQCLAAAQHTVPPPSPANGNAVFLIHSMHCYFVLAGDPTIPILYHVERVREGKSFITRTVQARQRGKCIFTTTLSFMREGSGGGVTVDHGWDMPEGVREGLERILQEERNAEDGDGASNGVEVEGPFISKRLGMANSEYSPCFASALSRWGRKADKTFTQIAHPTHTSVNHNLGFNAEAPSPLLAASTPTSQPSPTCQIAGSSVQSLGSIVSCARTMFSTIGPSHRSRTVPLPSSSKRKPEKNLKIPSRRPSDRSV